MPNALSQPVEARIFVDERELVELYPLVQEIRVEMRRGQADECVVVFDTLRREDGDWVVQDLQQFKTWSRFRVDVLFGRSQETLLQGYVREVSLNYPEQMGGATVSIVAQDESYALDRQHVRDTLSTVDNPQTDGQLAQQIANRHQLRALAEAGQTHENLPIDDTEIKFLTDRARDNGFEFYVRDGVLHFESIKLEGVPQSPILVYAGRATNCLNFEIEHGSHRPECVSASFAPEQGAELLPPTEFRPNLPLLGSEPITSGGQGLDEFCWTPRGVRGTRREHWEARMQAMANEEGWKIQATGELDGALYRNVLRNYETVDVDGVGSRYGGRYYVADVTHTLTSSGYRQRFVLLRNATGKNPAGERASNDRLAGVLG